MSQFFYIYLDNLQVWLINQVVEIVCKGGVIVYFIDFGYVLGCKIEDKGVMEWICCICQLLDGYNFILMCCDLFELLIYVFVDNVVFCLMKNNMLGNYIFIFKGIKEVLCWLLQEKCKIIGMCVLFNFIVQVLFEILGELMFFMLLMLFGSDFIEFDLEEIKDCLEKVVDFIIYGGFFGQQLIMVIDFIEDILVVLCEGVGDVRLFF